MPVPTEPPFTASLDLQDEATTAKILAAQNPMLSVSVLGLPAVSIPTGLDGGVPLGVQVVAGRYREDLCFDAAAIIEAHHAMPTPIDPRAGSTAPRGPRRRRGRPRPARGRWPRPGARAAGTRCGA